MFLGLSQARLISLHAGIIESHKFFCLTSYPGEIAHTNSANQQLSNDVLPKVVHRQKVALHTSSHLTPTEALSDALFPPLQRVVEFRVRYRQIPVRGFLGVGKIWSPCDLRSRSYKRFKVHTHTHTHTHTRTQGD